jgi:hypothetical protein
MQTKRRFPVDRQEVSTMIHSERAGISLAVTAARTSRSSSPFGVPPSPTVPGVDGEGPLLALAIQSNARNDGTTL